MYHGKTLNLIRLENDFLEICFDNQMDSVNKFNRQTLDELAEAMTIVKETAFVKGLLLTSNKNVFVVGADITEFSDMFAATESEFVNRAAQINRLFSDFEDLRMPSVAAINGFALGGGFEICLACDGRVMSSKALVGLPEITLGIMPGWGGTVRLPRVIGLEQSVNWITSGKPQSAYAAAEAGAIDHVVEPESLRDSAIALLSDLSKDQTTVEHRRLAKCMPVSAVVSDSDVIFEKARNTAFGRNNIHYPAAAMIVDLLAKSVFCDRDTAIRLENNAFYRVINTSAARALTGLFLAEQFVVKQAKLRAADRPVLVQNYSPAAIIGAGIMGGGIAHQSAMSGVPAIMKDIQQTALDLGIGEASKLLERSISRGKLSKEEAEIVLNHIKPTLDNKDLAECNIVVEAVVELESVKSAVLKTVESSINNSAVIITSNTSTISISRLADSLLRPENFCGMHFFNPVHAMPLVEIIRGKKTSDRTIATVCAYALKLGKKPIVVNDCPGFLVNRVLFSSILGMEMLVAQGADFQHIDRVMEEWGLPMGPAYLSDVIGLDTVTHCYSVLFAGLAERFIPITPVSPSGGLLNESRLGQKSQAGFYHYPINERGRSVKQVDPLVTEYFDQLFGKALEFDPDEIIARVMTPMAMEMVRCLEEGIVETPAEADMALIYGIGFPRFRGGICRWMDEVGLQNLCDLGDKYRHISPLYEPTQGLRAKAARGETMY
ncbi:MAG: fatty acid oxidation complex subunit alpha FadB [Porticoccaceae bacterium]|nr:fatty acid oxidation complex subunit alpha FadB [Porticoccaceae bacterium]